jgi:hypothetical protein
VGRSIPIPERDAVYRARRESNVVKEIGGITSPCQDRAEWAAATWCCAGVIGELVEDGDSPQVETGQRAPYLVRCAGDCAFRPATVDARGSEGGGDAPSDLGRKWRERSVAAT